MKPHDFIGFNYLVAHVFPRPVVVLTRLWLPKVAGVMLLVAQKPPVCELGRVNIKYEIKSNVEI